MKKIAFLFLIVIILIIFSFVLFRKENPFKKLGYSEEEIEVINTLQSPTILLEFDYLPVVIDFINHQDFKEEQLKRYIELSSLSEIDIDNIIYIVNHNFYDTSIDYTATTIALMKEEYYIHQRLDRYNAHYNTYQDLSLSEIITAVNTNIDNEFYTNTKSADLTKGYLLLVNKFYSLDKNYVPEHLVTIETKHGVNQLLEQTVYEQYKTMWQEATNKNLTLSINSPYRSYETQNYLYHNYGARDGYTLADTYSARAGHSEHQTGLAVDITSKSSNFDSFEQTDEFKWLKEHAHEFGFILRYPKGKEYITGYQYEPWHYRYVGVEVATKLKQSGLTFEEYYAYYLE